MDRFKQYLEEKPKFQLTLNDWKKRLKTWTRTEGWANVEWTRGSFVNMRELIIWSKEWEIIGHLNFNHQKDQMTLKWSPSVGKDIDIFINFNDGKGPTEVKLSQLMSAIRKAEKAL